MNAAATIVEKAKHSMFYQGPGKGQGSLVNIQEVVPPRWELLRDVNGEPWGDPALGVEQAPWGEPPEKW
jgi:hypothetical protein